MNVVNYCERGRVWERRFFLYALIISCCVCVSYARDASLVDAQNGGQPESLSEAGGIESVGVFKNGMAFVTEKYELKKDGRYSIDLPPNVVHGSFFIFGDAQIETTSAYENVAVAATEQDRFDWTIDLQDKWFNAVLPGEEEARLLRIVSRRSENENQSLMDPYGRPMYNAVPASSVGVFLEDKNGETFWVSDSKQVSKISFSGEDFPSSVVRRRGRLLLNVVGVDEEKGSIVRLCYLTKGLCWAPQYRVDIRDKSTLTIEQNAVLINDWRDVADASFSLISGFPQIEFKNALSPISPDVSLEQFIRSLNTRDFSGSSALITQQALMNNAAVYRDAGGENVDLPNDPSSGLDVDVYSKDVGVKTVAKNSRLLLNIDSKVASYKKSVRWNIPNSREVNGTVRNMIDGRGSTNYGATTSGSAYQDYAIRFSEPWDVLEFTNPFDFPITTGATTLTSGARFLGQNVLFWSNPGELTTLPITKALSFRVKSTEKERILDDSTGAGGEINRPGDAPPDIEGVIRNRANWGRAIFLYGTHYRIAVIDAEITLRNQRSEETETMITRQIYGQPLLETIDEDGANLTRIFTEGGYARFINPLFELKWSFKMKPNEERKLKFSYVVLIQG